MLRFHIPTALTSLSLGFLTAHTLSWFENDQLLLMLSRLGITSLFLFAGMEVEIDELKKNATVLSRHLVVVTIMIFF